MKMTVFLENSKNILDFISPSFVNKEAHLNWLFDLFYVSKPAFANISLV
jgi:hypothetical protein